MRITLTIAALMLMGTISAQNTSPGDGRELYRSELIPYSTAAKADEGSELKSEYFEPIEQFTQQQGRFSAEFTRPFAWANRQVLLRVGSASAEYTVFVNGQRVGASSNGATPCEFNITKAAKEGRNQLEIVVESTSSVADLEGFRKHETISLGECAVLSQPTVRVRDLFSRAWSSDDGVMVEVGVVVKTEALNSKSARIAYDLRDTSGLSHYSGHKDVELGMRQEDTVRFVTMVPDSMLWSTENPVMNRLMLSTRIEGRLVEFIPVRVGFRVLDIDAQGAVTINSEPVELKSVEVSTQVDSAQVARFKEKGYNTLLVTAGAEAESLYNMADQMGMLVVAQAPVNTSPSGKSRKKGGNLSNDPQWREAISDRAQAEYYVAKRHPSVIAISIAEESENGIALYESYLDMKRIQDDRAVIYHDAAGEWNSDKLQLK